MASLRNFWRQLLRSFGNGRPRTPRWVEPSNAVTRAIHDGTSFVTMATWEEPAPAFVPAPPAPMESAAAAAAPERPGGEGTTPKRPGVAA